MIFEKMTAVGREVTEVCVKFLVDRRRRTRRARTWPGIRLRQRT